MGAELSSEEMYEDLLNSSGMCKADISEGADLTKINNIAYNQNAIERQRQTTTFYD